MATRQFEPMSIGGIIDRTFTIYRENFIRFLAITAVVYVPIGLISALSVSMLSGGATVSHQTNIVADEFAPGMDMEYTQTEVGGGAMIAGLVGTAIAGLLSIIGKSLASGALLRSVSESYLGQEVTVGEAYGYVWPKIGTLIWASLLVGVVVILGFLLLIVPGIIFSLWFALVTPVIIVESVGASRAMSRSKALASGNLGKIFGTLFVIGIIGVIAAMIISWGGNLIGGALFGSGFGFMFVSQVASFIAEILVAPIWAVAIVLLYYDLRIRKEGFDLEMMARELAIPQAQPYGPASGPQV